MVKVEYSCFVRGLAWATNDRSLETICYSFENVTNSKIIIDCETGRSCGFGFDTFSKEQSMLDVIKGMNGKELNGRNITVNQVQSCGCGGGGGDGGFHRSKGGRSRGGGAGYGGSGSYGKSGGGGGYNGGSGNDKRW